MLEETVKSLYEDIGVERVTLRQRVDDGRFFPVTHEAKEDQALSLQGSGSGLNLKRQPVVQAMVDGAPPAVQSDTAAFSDDPEFRKLVDNLGITAQIVWPIRDGAELIGMISLHHTGGTRVWEEREINLVRQAAVAIGEELRK